MSKLLLFFDVDDPVRKTWDKADVNCVLWLDGGSWQAVCWVHLVSLQSPGLLGQCRRPHYVAAVLVSPLSLVKVLT